MFFFFKQKTAYEMRISDWSSDVCSSDLKLPAPPEHDPDKPTAVVLLSNQGAEVTDVLAPYEVLSESGAFNVYAAAPEREAVTLSGGLDVLPRSEERRVRKECVSTCRSRWSPCD